VSSYPRCKKELLFHVLRLSDRRIAMRSLIVAEVLILALAIAPPARGDTLIAVGTDYGKPLADGTYASTPLVLRAVTDTAADGAWMSSALPQAKSDDVGPPVLMGAAFSTTSIAWVYGGTETRPILFRSDDAGMTWRDVGDALPSAMQFHRVRGLQFASDKTGWMVSTTSTGAGPYPWRTDDGGASWQALPPVSLSIGSTFALGISDDDVQLFVSDGGETTIRSLTVSSETSAVDSKGNLHGAALAASGSQIWIVGGEETSNGRGSVAIYAAGADRSWTRQTVSTVPAELRAVDFANGTGLACGATVAEDPTRPLCIYTVDGENWSESTMPDGLSGMAMIAVVSTGKVAGYAVAQLLGAPGLAFLETSDEGKTWTRIITDFDATAHIRGLARSSSGRQ
jgi:photosystem II stability/assembly factor-like uncharacterized protein